MIVITCTVYIEGEIWISQGGDIWSPPGLHKTGIRGFQDTRQIVDGKTKEIENNHKKVGPDFLTKDNSLKKQFDTHT